MADDGTKWHPILACEEYRPGQWVMLDQYRRPYAMIDIIRRGAEVGYRVTTWEQESSARQIIGYFRNLRAAAASGHQRFLSAHTAGMPGRASTTKPYEYARGEGKANTPRRVERD